MTTATDPEAPWGRRADGTPRLKPGRPTGRVNYPELGDAEWLRARYVTEGLTPNQIAELLGFDCHRQSVLDALKRAGIKRRPPGHYVRGVQR